MQYHQCGGGNIFGQLDRVSSQRTFQAMIEFRGRLGPSERVCLRAGLRGVDPLRRVGRALRHDASGAAPSPVWHASSQVVSTQRLDRVIIGGNVDGSDCWVERMAA